MIPHGHPYDYRSRRDNSDIDPVEEKFNNYTNYA